MARTRKLTTMGPCDSANSQHSSPRGPLYNKTAGDSYNEASSLPNKGDKLFGLGNIATCQPASYFCVGLQQSNMVVPASVNIIIHHRPFLQCLLTLPLSNDLVINVED